MRVFRGPKRVSAAWFGIRRPKRPTPFMIRRRVIESVAVRWIIVRPKDPTWCGWWELVWYRGRGGEGLVGWVRGEKGRRT